MPLYIRRLLSGSIPAGAGEPRRATSSGAKRTVYPRGCGGTTTSSSAASSTKGLSPRVRGNPQTVPAAAHAAGSIPAGAGEPWRPWARARRSWVYPRGCGGTSYCRSLVDWDKGLSPRVRGNPVTKKRKIRITRSIPAGAGEPIRRSDGGRVALVYPRGCGGTSGRASRSWTRRGLSPRVRGNQGYGWAVAWRAGSIPAGAGEPRIRVGRRMESWVYPRGCGGTAIARTQVQEGQGLSPRVRGNPITAQPPTIYTGSIPAGAGEPDAEAVEEPVSEVYPRGCGGTAATNSKASPSAGLSPRVRGNLSDNVTGLVRSGSIPAGAGEPHHAGLHDVRCRVYPRGCGGTHSRDRPVAPIRGLSPRVRGNRLDLQPCRHLAGSIPAGAGEPALADPGVVCLRVYPRGCGGTGGVCSSIVCLLGLSPRVRGNPSRPCGGGSATRSIPAGAGEPFAPSRSAARCRVYPRGCGGTASWCRLHRAVTGLSPRVRGNLRAAGLALGSRGSIPAGAGEPRTTRTASVVTGVYPRGCGGTTYFVGDAIDETGLSPRVRGNRRAVL